MGGGRPGDRGTRCAQAERRNSGSVRPSSTRQAGCRETRTPTRRSTCRARRAPRRTEWGDLATVPVVVEAALPPVPGTPSAAAGSRPPEPALGENATSPRDLGGAEVQAVRDGERARAPVTATVRRTRTAQLGDTGTGRAGRVAAVAAGPARCRAVAPFHPAPAASGHGPARFVAAEVRSYGRLTQLYRTGPERAEQGAVDAQPARPPGGAAGGFAGAKRRPDQGRATAGGRPGVGRELAGCHQPSRRARS